MTFFKEIQVGKFVLRFMPSDNGWMCGISKEMMDALRKPRLDQGADYERGFIDGMQHQMQSSVDKAVNAMSQRTWVGLTDEEIAEVEDEYIVDYRIPAGSAWNFAKAIEAKLKEKNNG